MTVGGIDRRDLTAGPPLAADLIAHASSCFAAGGSYLWRTIQYRWVPPTAAQKMIDDWATFVIARFKGGEWRIMHVHSSTATPEPKDTSSAR